MFGSFNKKAKFVPKKVNKNQEEGSLLESLLRGSIMFQGLSGDNMKIVVEALEKRNYTAEQ